VVIAALLLVALFAPWLAPHDPLRTDYRSQLKGPGEKFILGADEYGRDILSRLIYGARVSLGVAFAAVCLATVFGVALGLAGGYFKGFFEHLTMRLSDVILCFPPILFAIAVVAFLGTSLINVTFVIGVLYTPRFARLVYGSVLTIKENEYIEGARALGMGQMRIIFRYILPNIMAPILVQISLSLGFAILLESGLSFLGLGAVPPTPSWGQMVAAARGYMDQSPLFLIWPSLTIAATILAFNTLGDGLRDSLDPRLRK